MNILKMAWRNVGRDRRRSAVTIAAITLGFTVMVLYSGLVQGYLAGMERNLLDIELGDIQIHHPDYRDDPSIFTRIEDPDALVEALEAKGYAASARLLGGGLAAAGEASGGVYIRGVDPARDAGVSQVYRHVQQGGWLDPARPGRVVLGWRLARTLNVKPGAELVLFSQAADGSIANDLFEVAGVLKGISDVTDRAGVFMTQGAFRQFFALPRGAHQVIVRTGPDVPLDQAAAEIEGLAPGLEVKTWRQIVPTMASLLDSTEGIIQMVFFIVYIAIGILVLNAMLMAVFERIREFGILKALGVSPGQVMLTILVESGLQTGAAVLIGLCLAIPGLWYLKEVGIDVSALGGGATLMGIAWDPIWRASISPATFAGPLGALVAIITVAVLYPAVKAARIDPIDAIHHH